MPPTKFLAVESSRPIYKTVDAVKLDVIVCVVPICVPSKNALTEDPDLVTVMLAHLFDENDDAKVTPAT
jgi:hypothetical protein